MLHMRFVLEKGGFEDKCLLHMRFVLEKGRFEDKCMHLTKFVLETGSFKDKHILIDSGQYYFTGMLSTRM